MTSHENKELRRGTREGCFHVTLNPYVHFIDHYLAVLCKFLGDFGKRYFFSKDRLI